MASGSDELELLVQDVVAAAKLPPKSRGTSIKPTVASLTSLIYSQGLLPDALLELVGLVTTPSHLDQASLSSITRNLFPATSVSRHVVLRVLSCLGHGKLKPSLNVQAALLRWLIMVYHVLETPAVLSQAYTVLFNLLDTAAIRPQLTHLLALITRRRHVKPFRIQMLLNLSRQTGNDPAVVGLLRVFKDYYPEIIVGEAVRGRASAFKHPDPPWRHRLDEIQEEHLQQTQEASSGPRDGFRIHRPINRAQRNKVVPVVHTSDATGNSITLEEVDNATSLVQHIDKLELPNQLVAVLADPLLQKLLLLRPSDEAYQRVSNWLNSVLQDVIDGDADESMLWDVLDVVRDFVTQTQTLPTVLLNFFARYFQLWSGRGPRDTIVAILAYAPLHDFQELEQHIFQPLETSVLDNTPASQLAVLSMYTKLLHHWTTMLTSSDSIPDHASATVAGLIRHVNRLTLTLLQTCPGVATDSAILDFYEQSVRLISDDTLVRHIRIELPPSSLIYTILFSSSLATVSRLCYILACYKRGFETAMSTKALQGSHGIDIRTYDRSYVNLYNSYIMDFCNCLWRARALSDSDTNSQGCTVPRPTVDALTAYVATVDKSFELGSLFSLSYSPVLCFQSIKKLRELEDAEIEKGGDISTRHAGPVTQSSLTRLATAGGLRLSWQDYRISVLEALSASELVGVAELLKNTMTVLKRAMDGTPRSSGTSTQRGL